MEENYKVFDIKKDIDERLIYLRKQADNLTNLFAKLPEGNLLVSPGKTNDSFKYYNRKSPQDKRGEYLSKSDDTLKKKLAMKKYVVTANKNISKEINKLEKIKKMQLSDSIVDTYVSMNPGVKKIIDPITVDDETYVKMWKSIPYEGLGFSKDDKTEYYSDIGERMRSKSEVAIANQLLKRGIPYKYECPVIRSNGEALYPDFTILDMRRRRIIYWEHLGRMGDISYVSKNIWKLDEYKKNGIYLGTNLYVTYESGTAPLGTNDILRIINEICSN